jgi:hypothetical protein
MRVVPTVHASIGKLAGAVAGTREISCAALRVEMHSPFWARSRTTDRDSSVYKGDAPFRRHAMVDIKPLCRGLRSSGQRQGFHGTTYFTWTVAKSAPVRCLVTVPGIGVLHRALCLRKTHHAAGVQSRSRFNAGLR